MKKLLKHKILLLIVTILTVGCFGSCSSWQKSKCGECPRWNYIMDSQLQTNN